MKSLEKQQGAAMLVFVLAILVGASYLLVSKLNANVILSDQIQETREALATAKSALIGYAATYPDDPELDGGPGYLPCPDTNNNGVPLTNCSESGGTTVGRLPHAYSKLGISELRDGSGERLWYVISNNHRYGPDKLVPLNSEIPGTLEVDDTDDVVAIIIAPGEPICGQNGRGASPNDPAQYFDGINAGGGEEYTQKGLHDCGGDNHFNDQMIFITRAELMKAVEKRVLGEMAINMQAYFEDYDYYPWMSPFDNPQTSDFRSDIGTCGGHIPLLDDPASGAESMASYLTPWLVDNDWHHLVLAAYENEMRPDLLGNDAVDCSPGTYTENFVVERMNGDPHSRVVLSLALIAGGPVPGQARPSDRLDYYFEQDNAVATPVISAWQHDSGFNDQVRVLAE